MIRETALRHAFRAAVERVLASDKPLRGSQARTVKQVVRVYDRGADRRTPRAK